MVGQQYHFLLQQKESLTLDDFLPASSNEGALRWLLQTQPSAWPSHAFLLWGPEASGKTHLGTVWATANKARALACGDESLSLIVSGEDRAPAYFLDDAHKCAGQADKEEWLQHLFNATKTANKPLLMTSMAPPVQWGLKLPDILTRLKSCPSAELLGPDDELMRGLLVKLFRDRQLLVDFAVVDYIAPRLERTGRAARELVAAIDAAALEGHRKISIPFVQKTMKWG
ncbi:MAG: DNA replication protein [Proteobacteria bacterium]|jgi:chromosomal replication initiation ATPase DnaA|nr:DnaA/Hda family protein [Alphaproteobacteria bacterium]NCC03592.1 DNA replication protein [Pseudomonadota bacterium]